MIRKYDAIIVDNEDEFISCQKYLIFNNFYWGEKPNRVILQAPPPLTYPIVFLVGLPENNITSNEFFVRESKELNRKYIFLEVL